MNEGTTPEACERCGKINPADIHTCTPKPTVEECLAVINVMAKDLAAHREVLREAKDALEFARQHSCYHDGQGLKRVGSVCESALSKLQFLTSSTV